MHRAELGPIGGGGGGGRPAPLPPVVQQQARDSYLWGAVGLAAAVAIHLALFIGLGVYTEYKKRHPEPVLMNVPIEVAVVEKAAPPPPPPKVEQPKPPPPKPVPMKLARAPRVKPPKAELPPPPTNAPPPPKNAPPPPTVEAKGPPSKNPQVITGITMESTVTGGSFAAPVGNTLYGAPARTARDPSSVKPYKAERYAPAAQVNELPHVTFKPDLRKFYPPEAAKAEIEADVVLRLLIDSDGSIVKIDVVNDPGHGLGPAAARAIRDFRFSPGKVNGAAVATTVPFVLRFQLN